MGRRSWQEPLVLTLALGKRGVWRIKVPERSPLNPGCLTPCILQSLGTVFMAMNLQGNQVLMWNQYQHHLPGLQTVSQVKFLPTVLLICFPSLVRQSEPIHCAHTVTHTDSPAVHTGLRWQPTLVWQAELAFYPAGLITCFLLPKRLLSFRLAVGRTVFSISRSWSALSCWNEVMTVCPKRSVFYLRLAQTNEPHE